MGAARALSKKSLGSIPPAPCPRLPYQQASQQQHFSPFLPRSPQRPLFLLPARFCSYFYATLYLGTPAKKFAVIVDTGSTMTYVPCSTCGSGCGPNHQDAAFDPEVGAGSSLMGAGWVLLQRQLQLLLLGPDHHQVAALDPQRVDAVRMANHCCRVVGASCMLLLVAALLRDPPTPSCRMHTCYAACPPPGLPALPHPQAGFLHRCPYPLRGPKVRLRLTALRLHRAAVHLHPQLCGAEQQQRGVAGGCAVAARR